MLFVIPGMVALHSHVGVREMPQLWVNKDVRSLIYRCQYHLDRAIDGYKSYDVEVDLVVSGGVISSLVLTGAQSIISEEGYVFKMKRGGVWRQVPALSQNGYGSHARILLWMVRTMAMISNHPHLRCKILTWDEPRCLVRPPLTDFGNGRCFLILVCLWASETGIIGRRMWKTHSGKRAGLLVAVRWKGRRL